MADIGISGCGGSFERFLVDTDKIKVLIWMDCSIMSPSTSSVSKISSSSSSGSSIMVLIFSFSPFNTVLFFASCSMMLLSEAISISFGESLSMIFAALLITFVK